MRWSFLPRWFESHLGSMLPGRGHSAVTLLCRCNLPCEIAPTVTIGATLQRLPFLRVLPPRPTVRWRLTLLFSLLFVICGAALLAITYYLFQKFAFDPPKQIVGADGRAIARLAKVPSAILAARAVGLHRLQIYSGIALGIMTMVSIVLGWFVAGQVLAPLRTITATTERISERNLHERLALRGPPDELRMLADTIDRLLERLEAAFEAQRRFVANASHELRTPLAM